MTSRYWRRIGVTTGSATLSERLPYSTGALPCPQLAPPAFPARGRLSYDGHQNEPAGARMEERAVSEQTPAPQPTSEQPLSERLKLWGAVALGVILIVFFLQNLHEAEVRFLWFEWTTRVIWALIVSALIGAAATLLIATIRRRSQQPPAPPPAQ